jgi:hypothetical protein
VKLIGLKDQVKQKGHGLRNVKKKELKRLLMLSGGKEL